MENMGKDTHEFYRLVKAYGLEQRRQLYEQLKIPLKLYEIGQLPDSVAAYWNKKLKPYTEELEKCPIPFPLAPDQEELGHYDVEFGRLKENPSVRAGIILDGIPRHLAVSGATGSGKSTFLRRIIIGINDYIEKTGKTICVLVINIKGDYRDLPDKFGKKIWDHYSVYDTFSTGCHPPIDCNDKLSWINQFTNLFASVFNLEYGEACFANVMRKSVECLNASSKNISWPSLPLIHQFSKLLPSHIVSGKPRYKQSFDHQLGNVLENTAQLFTAKEGFDVVKHLITPGRCAVIDCPNLHPSILIFFVNLLILQLMFSRVMLMQTSNSTNFVLVIDESDSLCSYETSRLFEGSYSPLAQLLKQGREFGIRVCLGMTNLGRCDPFITANAGELVFFQQQNTASVIEAAKALLQPDSQILLSSMKRGNAIFRESLGIVSYGMLLEADYVEPAKTGQPENFDVHPVTLAKDIKEYPELMAVVNQYKKTGYRKENEKDNIILRADSREFLDYASLYEYEPVKYLFERMKVSSPCRQNAITKELQTKELIEAVLFRSKSSPVRLVEITSSGWEFLGKKSRYKKLRGKAVHTHGCRWIQFWFQRQGFKAQCEVQIGKGFGDVVVEKEGKLIVYEVVVECSSNILKHIRDCFIESKKVFSLFIVTRTKTEWPGIEKIISKDTELSIFTTQIKFEVIDTFMKGLYNESD